MTQEQEKWRHKVLIKLGSFASQIFVLLPRRVQLWMGDVLGLFVYYVAPIRKKVAYENMQQSFPDWTEKKVKRTLRKMYMHMGRGLLEYFLIPHINKDNYQKYIEVEGLENVTQELKKGKAHAKRKNKFVTILK